MKCPKCTFENREEAKFCKECGAKLELACLECGTVYEPGSKFCDECGLNFDQNMVTEKLEPKSEGERKHVTVLFSDLTGYTAMSERLDPEEVKEITTHIFGEISKIVGKYEGFIEKYAGDAAMAIFGVPKAHEDDPIRAVKAAREIHERVEEISPEVENKIGQSLSMHTGINTGLVVTGEVDVERGTHGIAGDAINLASRLSNLAKPGEILVDVDTCHQIEGHFACEYVEETAVKGKSKSVQIHKVLEQREKPVTVRRLSGVRAKLVGRKAEMAELAEAVEGLRRGRGKIFSIKGNAGTGKSRLVEEFKSSLDLEEVQWIEGHAYAYTQNIPFFPIIDLLNRIFNIKEGDQVESVRKKIESGIQKIVDSHKDIIPYVGGLYSLSYPEVEEVSPEFWRTHLQKAIQTILTSLATKKPTIFFLEDLHWADPSFVELLRRTCLEMRQPAVVLCVYRPNFSLFTGHQLSSLGKVYHEIRLQDLSLSDAQQMLESLLKTESIPSELKRVVHRKAEGNPFYLEELINTMIESGTLAFDDFGWKLTRPITESDISSSLHGLIAGRLDRLEKETKRVLQEASVIGRVFFYEILKKVTELKHNIDENLKGLEQLDLIRGRTLQPDLEYMFKHALTQEVVYNGLLKKERKEIHDKIGCVMEQLFQDRLPDFYETLAFHFKQSHSVLKAIDYLMKSGAKSLKRYAVEESHQYYLEAYEILSNKPDRTTEEDDLLIGLLIDWADVFYYRGDFKKLSELLAEHQASADSLDDKVKIGMFYAWVGWAFCWRMSFKEANQNLRKALTIGEEIGNHKVIGYASTWLAWNCAELGLLEEAVQHGERGYEIARRIKSDQYLHFKSLAGLGHTFWYTGERKKAFEAGKRILEFGQKYSNIRSIAMGYFILSYSAHIDGDFPLTLEYAQKAIQVSVDPLFSTYPKVLVAMGQVLTGQLQEARDNAKEVLNFSRDFGIEWVNIHSRIVLSFVSILKGDVNTGLKILEEERSACLESERKSNLSVVEYLLGSVYLQIAQIGETSGAAVKQAEAQFCKAIEVAKKIGANGILSQASLDLGLLYKSQGRNEKARKYISDAITIFKHCGVGKRLKQAREALE